MGANAPNIDTGALSHRHVDALDGLRALAVAAVLLFHGGVSWAEGGFLGVEAFFVLSGFLITSLLLDEWHETGRISLSAFWGRRARRLLPAVLAVVLACAVYERIAGISGVPDFGADALATIFYVANWHQVWVGSGYFALTGPASPLLHTWSLAIEEQFYIVWPLVLVGLLRLTKRLSVVASVAAAGAIGSSIEMAVLYHGGAGLNRVYYGTDTRAQALLAGAVLAMCLRMSRRAPASERVGTVVSTAGTFLGLGGLAVWIVIASGSSGWLFRGGFLAVDATVVVLLASLVKGRPNPLSWLLGSWPFRSLGAISYGVYLWHYPLFLWLTATRTGIGGNWLLLVQVAATLAAATVSYFVIERPIRQRRWPRLPRLALIPVGSALAAAAVILSWGVGTTAFAGMSTSALHHLDQPARTCPSDTTCDDSTIMVVGDSLAVTLGIELQVNSLRYGMSVVGEARLGCGFTVAGEVDSVGDGFGPLNSYCATEIPNWQREERALHPQAIVVERGLWDELTWEQGNQIRALGDPAYDSQLVDQMSRLVRALGSPTVPVIFLSVPVVDPAPWANGEVPPMASPVRNQLINSFLRSMATEFPGEAYFFNLSPYVTPGNQFEMTVDGQVCRTSDGVHFYNGTPPNLFVQTRCGARLQSALLPYVRRLITAHSAAPAAQAAPR